MDLATAQTLGSLIGAGVAVAAVFVAIRAGRIAEQAVATARRQLAIEAVPYLVIADAPYGREDREGTMKLRVDVLNGGVVPALGIRAAVYAADDAFAVDEASRQASRRHPALVSGASTQLGMSLPESLRTAEPGGRWVHRFMVVELDYFGPHGSTFLQSYLWDTQANSWRVRHLTIDPGDAGEPIDVDISL
jgi:hypothetical protein